MMIPVWLLNPKLIAGVAAVAVLFGGGWMARGKLASAQIARIEAAQAQREAQAQEAYRQALEDARKREASLQSTIEGIAHDARQAETARDVARRDAAAAAGRLRDAAARYAATRCAAQAAGTAGGSPPGAVPAGVHDADRLLRVLGELDSRAGDLADHADRSRAAGLACERIYEVARQQLAK